MSKSIERIRQLRKDALEEKAAVRERIDETLSMIRQICRQGVIPFDEAWPAYQAAFNAYADGGQRTLEKHFFEWTRPNHPDPTSHNKTAVGPRISEPFMMRQYPNGLFNDTGPLIAWLNRDAILAEAKAYLSKVCADPNVPPESKRQTEIDRLFKELEALREEEADIQDELSELFETEPSQRTKDRRRQEEEERRLAAINGPIEERNKRNSPAEPSQSPVTIRDEDGQDVDDPEHGPSVRSA